MELSQITPSKGKRSLLIGGTRSGKSCLLDMLMRQIVVDRPHAEILLLDSKPRFRAEAERFGPGGKMIRLAEPRYTDWEKGPVVPGSVRLNIYSDNPTKGLWKKDDKLRIAIAQTEEPSERGRLLTIADEWYKIRKAGADRVLVVDELLDFYHRNTLSIAAARDVALKVNRAGGERGFSGLYGAQRPKRFASANCRRIVSALSIPFAVRGRYKISLGYGYS